MAKQDFSNLLRKLRLLQISDKIRFYLQILQYKGKNDNFLKQSPDVALPPDYLIYESFKLDYDKYYNNGKDTAEWLINLLSKHIELPKSKILDWGCGPARIIRHLPELIGNSHDLWGTDYNSKTINWCKTNIKDISFSQNDLEPPLKFDNNFFDIIYGISIFTHLSENMHQSWINELLRILKPKGIILLSTQGNAFIRKLNSNERNLFDKGKLVIRGNTKEGHRTYSAFQPSNFMINLFKDFEILQHIEGKIQNDSEEQDVWLIRKSQQI